MILPITHETIIADFQRKFQADYPYLHLIFFKPAGAGQSPTVKRLCNPANRIGAEIRLRKEGEIDLQHHLSVKSIINMLYHEYGIRAQILRKSGNLWMEITLTSNWTLEQQNELGKELSGHQ